MSSAHRPALMARYLCLEGNPMSRVSERLNCADCYAQTSPYVNAPILLLMLTQRHSLHPHFTDEETVLGRLGALPSVTALGNEQSLESSVSRRIHA